MKMQKKQKIKILLVQITNKNFGDSVIADNTRYLIKRAFPRWKKDQYDILDYAINTEDLVQVRYVDAVIFAGGGLVKFRQENLYRQVSELIMEAQKYEVPVCLNAVGVEGYDPQDPRCVMLQNALNQPCVKVISVRDDVQGLKEHYIHNADIRIRSVFDPAVWTEKAYQMKKSKQADQKCIGLGVARDSLFTDYGIPSIDREYLLALWKNIAVLLEQKGYTWRIFTNGLEQDEVFAQAVLQEIGHGKKEAGPVNAQMLIQNIAQLDGMIACRMHSNIIAYAFGIPSIGLVWNSKMTFWGEKIGYPQRFIPDTRLKAEIIVEALDTAMHEKCRKPSWKAKNATYKEIRYFLKKYGTAKEKEKIPVQPSKHLAATALGGVDFKYKNMNTISQIQKSVDHGYQYLELDIRLTEDGTLVCVNGWGKNIWKILGKGEAEGEMKTSDFLDAKYYQYFPTCTFEQFVQQFALLINGHDNIKVILDTGRPKNEFLEQYYTQLVETLQKYKISEKNVLIRMQRQKDVRMFEKMKYPCQMIFYLSQENAQEGLENQKCQEILSFCKKKKIRRISMSEKTWSPELQKELADLGIKTVIFSYTKVGDMLEALNAGADIVASHYYDVDYVKRLLN